MKIIHIIDSLGGGGRERRMFEVVRSSMQIDDIDLKVCVFHPRLDYLQTMENSVEVIILDVRNFCAVLWSLYKVIRHEKPDIVHLWAVTGSVGLAICMLKSVFRFKLIAGFIADCNKYKITMANYVNRLIFSCAESIVSNSKAGLIAKKAPMEKSCVIYNGFDFSRVKGIRSIDEIKEKFGLRSKYIVSMFARVDLAKDYEMFMSVAMKVLEKRDDILFLAVGGGAMLEYYKSRCVNVPNIRFMGHASDVESLMIVSDICVLFTNSAIHAEGVSNSVMEAMAVGKPVVATSGGGTAEIINSGVDGIIVPPGSIEETSMIIHQLLTNRALRLNIGHNAKMRIEKDFLQIDKTRQYHQLYDRLLN